MEATDLDVLATLTVAQFESQFKGSSKRLRRTDGDLSLYAPPKGKKPPSFYHSIETRGVDLHLFRGDSEPYVPNFPTFKVKSPATTWVVAVLSEHSGTWEPALFVGSWSDALKVFLFDDQARLEDGFRKFLSKGTDVSAFTYWHKNFTDTYDFETTQAIEEHKMRIITQRNLYRKRISEVNAAIDKATRKADADKDVTYHFIADGYPPSKPVSTYRDARRAHSKRNDPIKSCIIYRTIKNKSTPFAVWDEYSRTWRPITGA